MYRPPRALQSCSRAFSCQGLSNAHFTMIWQIRVRLLRGARLTVCCCEPCLATLPRCKPLFFPVHATDVFNWPPHNMTQTQRTAMHHVLVHIDATVRVMVRLLSHECGIQISFSKFRAQAGMDFSTVLHRSFKHRLPLFLLCFHRTTCRCLRPSPC